MKSFSKKNALLATASLIVSVGIVSAALAQTPAAPVAAPLNITAPLAQPTTPLAQPVTPLAQPGAPPAQPTTPPAQVAAPPANIVAPASPNPKNAGAGPKVTDILAQPAEIRDLPEKYLVVKKTQGADGMDARLAAARTALAQGSYQAALQIFSDLYVEFPHNKRVLMGRAITFQKLGQREEALAAYELALRNDPKNLEALTNMLGLLDKADQALTIEKLHQLRDIYPSNADITAQLGLAYGMAGDYEKALKYLEMAHALEPGNANILYNRAIVYDRMGKKNRAADLYRQIVLLGEDGSLDHGFPLETVKKRLSIIR